MRSPAPRPRRAWSSAAGGTSRHSTSPHDKLGNPKAELKGMGDRGTYSLMPARVACGAWCAGPRAPEPA